MFEKKLKELLRKVERANFYQMKALQGPRKHAGSPLT